MTIYEVLNIIYIGTPCVYLLGYIIAYVRLIEFFKNNEIVREIIPFEVSKRFARYISLLSWIVASVDFDRVINNLKYEKQYQDYEGYTTIPKPNPIEELPV